MPKIQNRYDQTVAAYGRMLPLAANQLLIEYNVGVRQILRITAPLRGPGKQTEGNK